MRISPPRSVDGIYEIVDESARLSSLHTVEPISRNGRGESRRPFLGGCDGAPSTRGRFVVVISFRAESIEGIKRFSRIRYHGLGAHVTVRFTTQGTFKLRALLELSHHSILETESDWRDFFMPPLSVATFIAEALKVFVETFPETKSLLIDREQTVIENYRGWLRDKRAQPK